jgi:hypothetical protein
LANAAIPQPGRQPAEKGLLLHVVPFGADVSRAGYAAPPYEAPSTDQVDLAEARREWPITFAASAPDTQHAT